MKTVQNTMRRFHLGQAPIDTVGAEEAAHWVNDRAARGLRTSVVPVNAAIVVLAARHPEIRPTLDAFDLALADGFWPAFATRCLSGADAPHANTSPFLRALFAQSGSTGFRVFLLGGRPEVVEKAAAILPQLYPEGRVVGHEHGYFDASDEQRIVDQINASGASLLLLGMSSPKKEAFVRRNWQRLTVLVSVGVGGAFDIWAGEIREAPTWVRVSGFEWLFRLSQEPRRLLKRYTIDNMLFLCVVLEQLAHRVCGRSARQ